MFERGFMNLGLWLVLVMVWLSLGLVSGCAMEEISRSKPWWEEVQFDDEGGGMSGGGGSGRSGAGVGELGGGGDVGSSKGRLPTVIENADGSRTLISTIPAHLVNHLHTELLKEDYDLILEQLVAESAKAMYEATDRDSWEIVVWMQSNRRDVIKLLMRMTAGLNSPDMTWTQRGKVFRLQLTGRTAQGMRFTTMDIEREDGLFRLILIK